MLSLEEVAARTLLPAVPDTAVACLADGVPASLRASLPRSSRVSPLLADDPAGILVLHRSYVLLVRAAAAQTPSTTFTHIEVAHRVFSGVSHLGVVCRAVPRPSSDRLAALRKAVADLIAADAPIEPLRLPRAAAIKVFQKAGDEASVRLVENLPGSCVDCVCVQGFFSLALEGAFVSSTGILKDMEILPFEAKNPSAKENNTDVKDDDDEDCGRFVLAFQQDNKGLEVDGAIAESFAAWRRDFRDILGVTCAGDVNRRLVDKKSGVGAEMFAMLCEEEQTARLVAAAREIRRQYDSGSVRLVLIAGPSSSGKTTFANKLAMQLRAAGLRPLIVSVDNYYKPNAECPLDEKGQYDFECLEALRVDKLNEDLLDLLAGKEARSPVFDFAQGIPSPTKHIDMHLPEHGIVIMEGIHCLNDALTPRVERSKKLKIFVAPLSPLPITESAIIADDQLRLIRRIVRDYRSRGYTALQTIARWPSVRKGEDLNIFPFVREADIVYNTSLAYEIPVLRAFAVPLLRCVDTDSPHLAVADSLLRFMEPFLDFPHDQVPSTSLLREFIGGSFYNTG